MDVISGCSLSVLYLVINSAVVAKKLGCRGFCGNFWHMADLSTILISIAAIGTILVWWFFIHLMSFNLKFKLN